MTLTDTLTKLLEEHEQQAKNPELWEDEEWKTTYYWLLDRVHSALERLDIPSCSVRIRQTYWGL